jgi:hypothetical protein
MTSKQRRNIAIGGGSGTIGCQTVSALLKTGLHTAISRATSDASFPLGVQVKKGDYTDEDFLVSALQGQSVLVMQLSVASLDIQTTLIKAATKAGIRWVLPTEFGSDPYAPMVRDLPMLAAKKKYRDDVEQHGMNWIAVVTNPWFDWSLKQGIWSIDIPARQVTLCDGGTTKFNTTTLDKVSKGVAALLSLPDQELRTYKNRPVFISSFYINQRDILSSVIRATKTNESEWNIAVKDADEIIKSSKEQVAKGEQMAFVTEFYAMHIRKGYGGDYQSRAMRDAEMLGLDQEDLEAIVRSVVKEL